MNTSQSPTYTQRNDLINTNMLRTITIYQTDNCVYLVACVMKYIWTDGSNDYIRYEGMYMRIKDKSHGNQERTEAYVSLSGVA